MRTLLLLIAMPIAASNAASDSRDGAATESRFAVRASFQPEPKAVANGRYSLRGQFTREAQAAPPLEAVGFSLKASFAPKSTCIFPTVLFKNGFESTP
jgi:hypothetical protein